MYRSVWFSWKEEEQEKREEEEEEEGQGEEKEELKATGYTIKRN